MSLRSVAKFSRNSKLQSMGLCTSKANRNVPSRHQYAPIKHQSSLKKHRSSTHSITSTRTIVRNKMDLDFRRVIVIAYIHHLQSNDECLNQRELPQIQESIIECIIAYYPKYLIYGINANDIDINCKFIKLNQFENTVCNINNIYTGNNRFYIKDIYDDLQCWNGFEYSHNTGTNELLKKDNHLFEISKMDIIRNSHSSQLNNWMKFQPELKKKHKKFTIKIIQIECGKNHVLLLSSKGLL